MNRSCGDGSKKNTSRQRKKLWFVAFLVVIFAASFLGVAQDCNETSAADDSLKNKLSNSILSISNKNNILKNAVTYLKDKLTISDVTKTNIGTSKKNTTISTKKLDDALNNLTLGTGDKTTAEQGYVIDDVASDSSEEENRIESLVTDTSTDEDEEEDEDLKKCADGGGVSSLSWVFCPIMSVASGWVENIYDTFIKPALQINPQLFTGESGNTLEGWKVFRNIANVAFIIMLLLVIFSQVTGYGLDNYGIKKTLSKLIITAVLINLSYFICVALVDVSNIAGNSLQAMLNGLGSGLDPTIQIDDASLDGDPDNVGKAMKLNTGKIVDDEDSDDASDDSTDEDEDEDGGTSSKFSYYFRAIGVFVVLAGMAGAVWTTAGVAATIIVGAISMIVSVIVLFVLLALRQVTVVVLTVISPLAIVCYMLPNTQTLFTKWKNIFKEMLILYPTAGVLIGGGNYVSSLILATGGAGFFTAMIAMLAGIVPIFFIPTLTRKAVNGLGELGTTINGFGDKFSKKASGRVEQSQLVRGLREKAGETKIRRDAGINRKGDISKIGRIKSSIPVLNRGMGRSRADYLRNVDAKNRDSNLMSQSGWNAAKAGIESKAAQDQISNYESLLKSGKEGINALNMNEVGDYYKENLSKAMKEKDTERRKEYLARAEAAQNILSTKADGRAQLYNGLEELIKGGNTEEGREALREAATHAMNNFGGTLKDKDKRTHALMKDIAATGDSLAAMRGRFEDNNGAIADVAKAYKKAGITSYTPETLGGADEEARKGLEESITGNLLSVNEKADLKNNIKKLLKQSKSGTIQIKADAERDYKNMLPHL